MPERDRGRRGRAGGRAEERRGRARSGARAFLLGALALVASPFLTGEIPGSGDATALAAQETHLLVVAGLGGEPEFRTRFREWGAGLVDAALEAGVPRERVIFLAEEPDSDPERIRARSTREEVERAFREIAERSAPNDRVLVVLIGHGSGSGEDSRVSLPGPSLRAAEYAALVDELPARTVAVVNAASASGDFVPVLSGEGRIVITATRSSSQRNAALFGEHFAGAFSGTAADLDHDGRVSLLEAFEYARRETERHYDGRGLIPTEQALLEDAGTGRGVTDPSEDPAQGTLAARFFLGAEAPAAATEPETARRLEALYREREDLEDRMAELTRRRADVDPDRYQEELEALLLSLARVGQEIRRLEGGDG